MNKSPENNLDKKQDRYLGIASVIISVISTILIVPWVILGFFLFSRLAELERGAFAAYIMASAVFAIIIIVLHLIGTILGIISWSRKRKGNSYAKIGTIANSFLIILDIFLILFLIAGLFLDFLKYVPVH